MKSHLRSLLSLIISLALTLALLSGCNTTNKDGLTFDEYTTSLFTAGASSDTLTLNYTLANPATYGITSAAISFGNYNYQGIKSLSSQAENVLSVLDDYDYDSLSGENQILYDNLEMIYHKQLSANQYAIFDEPLSPTTGLQAQLPVLLCEFNIRSRSDIETYLTLLSDLPGYFNQILVFETLKAQKGYFMNASTASQIIAQCQDFVAVPNKNLLIVHFRSRLQEFDFLSNKQRRSYLKRLRSIVTSQVIPAYQNMASTLEALKDGAKDNCGLASYHQGKAFYEYLMQTMVGTSRTIASAKDILSSYLRTSLTEIATLTAKDKSLSNSGLASTLNTGAPSSILQNLSLLCGRDFPAIPSLSYEVKYVDSSLEDYLSPAFYLTPPIDDASHHCIYINHSSRFANTNLYPTLAHEGYPGHLYQNAYLRTHSINPLKASLHCTGYSEGYATYAELYSYNYTGFSKDTISLLKENTISTLCLYALCDIGIHYDGWSFQDTCDFITKSLGAEASPETVLSLFQGILAEPGSYLPYALGYIELMELKGEARKYMGDDFTDLAFHQYILDAGPSWFDVLHKHLKDIPSS